MVATCVTCGHRTTLQHKGSNPITIYYHITELKNWPFWNVLIWIPIHIDRLKLACVLMMSTRTAARRLFTLTWWTCCVYTARPSTAALYGCTCSYVEDSLDWVSDFPFIHCRRLLTLIWEPFHRRQHGSWNLLVLLASDVVRNKLTIFPRPTNLIPH